MRTPEQIREYLEQFKAKKLKEKELQKEKAKKAKEQAKKPKKVKLSQEEAKAKIKEYQKAYQKEYRKANRERILEQQRDWYQAHKEEQIEKHREYRVQNREYLNALQREKYQAKKLIIVDLYQTREELIQAEETENARIDWTAWDKLVKETREKLLS